MKKIVFLLSIMICSNFYAHTSSADEAQTHPLIDRIDTDLVWVQHTLNKPNLASASVALLEKLKKALRTIQQNVSLLARYSKEHANLIKLQNNEYIPLIEKYISGTQNTQNLKDSVDAMCKLEEKVTAQLHAIVGTHPLAVLAEQHIQKIAEKQREGIMSTEEADLLEKLKKAISKIRHNTSLLSSYPDMLQELEKAQQTEYTPVLDGFYGNKISLADTVAQLTQLAEVLEVALNARISDGVKVKGGKNLAGRLRGLSESALGRLKQAKKELTRRATSGSFDSTSYEGLSDSDE